MYKIGVIGIGLMGKGITANLLKAGNGIVIYSIFPPEEYRKDEKLMELQAAGATIVTQREKLFDSCDIIVTCLPNYGIVEENLIGETGLSSFSNTPVKLVIDFSTTMPDSTQKISEILKGKGIEMLDTPMGGGPKQAAEGSLMIAVGGDKAVYEKYLPILKCVAGPIVYMGKSGSGHATKLINNFLGILNQATASASYLLCDKLGIDRKNLYDFISVSGANSKGFQSQSDKIFDGTFPVAFALDYATKDLNYARELFNSNGIKFEVVDDIAMLFTAAQTEGYGKQDVGTIHKYLENKQD